jgi:hypothetical protein
MVYDSTKIAYSIAQGKIDDRIASVGGEYLVYEALSY